MIQFTIDPDKKWVSIHCDPIEIREIFKICDFSDKNNNKNTKNDDDEVENVLSLLFTNDNENKILYGNLPWLVEKLELAGLEYEIKNKEVIQDINWFDLPTVSTVLHPELLSGVTLRDYQIMAIKKALILGRGIIKASPGSGKSEIAIGIIKAANLLGDYPSLFNVNTEYSLIQTYKRLVTRLGSDKEVGMLGSGHNDLDKKHLVAIINSTWSLLKKGKFEDLERRKLIFSDECHHSAANSWLNFSLAVNTFHLFGLSATPFNTLSKEEYSYRDLLLQGAIGKVIVDINYDYLRSKGLAPTIYVAMAKYKSKFIITNKWHEVYKQGIINNSARNDKLLEIVKTGVEKHKRILILVNRHLHGDLILHLLHSNGITATAAYGGGVVKVVNSDNQIESIKVEESVLETYEREGGVLIGSPVLDESIDLPSIDIVIIASAGRSIIKVIQKAGRGMRGSGVVYVYDFIDLSHFYLKHQYRHRLKIYEEEMKFQVIDYDYSLNHIKGLVE